MSTGKRRAVKRSVLSGMAIAIPIVATIALLVFLFNIVAELLRPAFVPLFERVGLVGRVPGAALAALAMLITLFALAVLGMLVQNRIGRRLKKRWNDFLSRVPIVGALYEPIHQLVEAFTKPAEESGIKMVIRFPYPAEPLETLGFVTDDWTDESGVPKYKVFLPMALTPTEGFFLIVPKSVAKVVDMTVSDALKLVVSAGFVDQKKNE